MPSSFTYNRKIKKENIGFAIYEHFHAHHNQKLTSWFDFELRGDNHMKIDKVG